MSTGKDCSWAGRTGTLKRDGSVGGKSLPTLNKVGFGTAFDLMSNSLSEHFCLPRQSVSLRVAEWRWGQGNQLQQCPLVLPAPWRGLLEAQLSLITVMEKSPQWMVWSWEHIPERIKNGFYIHTLNFVMCILC